jgi:ceramide glucosyltransferase
MLYIYIAAVVLALVFYSIQSSAVWLRLRRLTPDPSHDHVCSLPPISVLKPLKGLDDQLEENLASFCEQDYPYYEIIFCVQEPDDPSIEVARRIICRYPHQPISLVVHCGKIGLNPKVNNLAGGYEKARFNLILISDSNVRVRPDYLKEIASCRSDPSIGLVSNLILGTGAKSMGASLENLHLNSFVISSINFLDRFRNHQIVVGKSMLFSRCDLEGIGGLDRLKDVLAEDYVMGKSIRETGRKVYISPHLIHNVNVRWSLAKFWKRHVRWGQLRFSLGGAAYFWEIIVNPVFLALLPLFVGQTSKVIIGMTLTSSAFKSAGDYLIGRRLGADLKGPTYLLVPFKDFLVGLMWFYPFLIRTVTWREHTYRIISGSRLREIEIPDDLNWPRRLLFKLRARTA